MDEPDYLKLARAQWRWRGLDRPPFAENPKQGQVSVWDFPRPPELIRDPREIVVQWGKTLIEERLVLGRSGKPHTHPLFIYRSRT